MATLSTQAPDPTHRNAPSPSVPGVLHIPDAQPISIQAPPPVTNTFLDLQTQCVSLAQRHPHR
jgi:hypothetical protein